MSPLSTAPAPLTGADGQRRAAYLAEVLRLLYPLGPGAQEYAVLPHARRPRLLVPTASAAAAAGAVRRGSPARHWSTRFARRAAAAALYTGVGRFLPDRVRVEFTGSVQQYLHRLLDQPVVLAIHIGASRAERKPVLHLLDPTGDTIGFAKLGTGPLTRALVQAEAGALMTLASRRLRQLTVPALRHVGRWRAHQLLVQSAVPNWRRPVPCPPHRLAQAMREVAHCCGTGDGQLASSRYWQRLTRRIHTAATVGDDTVNESGEATMLATAAAALAERTGPMELRYGAWHGDWAPWNMAALPDTVLLWDWERFDTGVPLGFDALHHDLQRRLKTQSDAASAVTTTLARTAQLLAPFDIPPAAQPVTAALYLIELATRYLADRQAAAGAPLGVLGSGLLPVLLQHLTAMERTP